MDINSLIGDSIKALDAKDPMQFRKISADALTEAAVEGHREVILVALVDYALSKILSKIRYQELGDKFFNDIRSNFESAKGAKKEEIIAHLEEIENLVVKMDSEQGNYSDNVIEKAKIKKASALYEKGMSLRQASQMTGADPVRVLDYIGGSKIHELEGFGTNAERLRLAREVFGE